MELLWGKVAKQVEDQGLALGVYVEMPERRLADKSSLTRSERTRAAQSPRWSSS
jgi:hypothetical protein